ncbi:MAG: hypothetical protein KGI78_04510 [Patescibacteria group bacterium]|nr:hypothetical protein [Patescibacteria group bacterium]MDE1944123.1 hypothetical protein [Patescibacteria group bacterium]MDE1944744.1 hypothetical protein [Patescibacteria group bacterium]MDE2058073.1 hypothetical protein [Patescibacteria group bacterium]
MHAFLASGHQITVTIPFSPVLLAVAALWTLAWKGFALWYAARGEQKGWFVVMLVVNTLGILEIIYLIWFRSAEADHDASDDAQPEHSSPAA